MQTDIDNCLVFENPRTLHHTSGAILNDHHLTQDSKTTSHRSSSPQSSAELMPTQWLRLGPAKQSGQSWNWRDERELSRKGDPAAGNGLPEFEEERKSANQRSPTQSLVSETTAPNSPTRPRPASCQQVAAGPKPSPWREGAPTTREVASWNPEWESEMRQQRYSATTAALAELEEERNFVKLEKLFSPAPDDYDRQGRRARARGIVTWVIPTETAANSERPVHRSASTVAPRSEKERLKRRR